MRWSPKARLDLCTSRSITWGPASARRFPGTPGRSGVGGEWLGPAWARCQSASWLTFSSADAKRARGYPRALPWNRCPEFTLEEQLPLDRCAPNGRIAVQKIAGSGDFELELEGVDSSEPPVDARPPDTRIGALVVFAPPEGFVGNERLELLEPISKLGEAAIAGVGIVRTEIVIVESDLSDQLVIREERPRGVDIGRDGAPVLRTEGHGGPRTTECVAPTNGFRLPSSTNSNPEDRLVIEVDALVQPTPLFGV